MSKNDFPKKLTPKIHVFAAYLNFMVWSPKK